MTIEEAIIIRDEAIDPNLPVASVERSLSVATMTLSEISMWVTPRKRSATRLIKQTYSY